MLCGVCVYSRENAVLQSYGGPFLSRDQAMRDAIFELDPFQLRWGLPLNVVWDYLLGKEES